MTVTGVWGGSAALPCHVSHPPDDSIYLLLWFRDQITTPIYRLDERWLGLGKENHWWDEQHLGARASLEVSSPALLRISSLTLADQGLYTCRVDFKLQPTKTTRVNLTVVVPPESVSVVVDGWERAVTSVVGPYQEGDLLVLTCIAHGGHPRPSVVWFEDTHLLDSHMESHESYNKTRIPTYESNTTMFAAGPSIPTILNKTSTTHSTKFSSRHTGGEPYNTLTLGPLTRNDLKLLLTCEASNNNLTLPTSMVVMVDMNLPPLSVVIRAPELPLTAGREYQVVCEVRGSRPPPTITWYNTDTRILESTDTTSADGNVTTSSLVFTPQPQDNGSFLRCIAETQAVPTSSMEDIWNLTVYYLPTAAASFGSSLDSSNIKEGDDVYLECSILAHPRASHVSWRHNNEVLVHNVSGGVIISNQSLVLQRVLRAQAGRYSCHAHNVVGDGSSNSLRLDVKYAPVCSPGQVTSYAVGRYEDAEVTCSVQANPLQASFQWTFNNTADTIDVPQGRFTSSSSHSIITYTPMTSLDYGTLLCWASNEIGTQRDPCVFHIIPAGKPDPPSNCTVGQRTRTSVRVRCVAGSSGGLTQQFHLQAKLHDGDHIFNLTSANPNFFVETLQAGQKYDLVITAFNEKGSSNSIHTTISSMGSNGSVYQPHDGPSEAEVRDGSKNVGGPGNTFTGVGGSDGKNKYLTMLDMPSLMPAALGIGAGLVLIIIVLILLITFRTRLPHHVETQQDIPSQDTEADGTPDHHHLSPVTTHHTSCLERDTQVDSESDADPDVIPLQEGCCSPARDPPPAILLPPDRYKYSPVPTLLTTDASPRCGGVAASSSPLSSVDHCDFPLHFDSAHSDVSEHVEASCPSTLPETTAHPPSGNKRYSCKMNPHHLPYPGIEGSLPPPPVEYQNYRVERESTSASHAVCVEDAPDTPLLSKRESSV
ncbi:protein turtle homolog B-like [Panulirus ornatus]|uniref:protein turtle homolog B-like n=1 Tax=Panulirus ornatus TaxID=150431 RepID=UPI003A8C039A